MSERTTEKTAGQRRVSQGGYLISLAAEIVGMHPQTLRIYESRGLVEPQRSEGNTRRYSESDLARLRRIQELTELGLNLAGVRMILDMEETLEAMRRRFEARERELLRRLGQL